MTDMQSSIHRFNIRVYFLLGDPSHTRLLVADELIRQKPYTKFPGGGLEYGEGTHDCVRREAMEELGQDVEVTDHYYTTDFFMRSAFRETDQVVSIYYTARLVEEPRFRISSRRFDFQQDIQNEESFRWVAISDLDEDDFAFPADKAVISKIRDKGIRW
jgi:8-oxo-dGTP diphosphatase